ncbi:MAG: ribosome-associated translation inhibitor RaiA [Lentisphaeria bacterium]|nr:ribosome-associated translation inhibitor RaiA [Candidatus Neomarinimicrobiota bacterium]MCF7842306.1 ribosome-associated translation inhibitor RaiA [Lentisphaeria bacterium]
MKVDIVARHFDIADKTNAYVSDEVARLEKYFDRITSCRVILEKITDLEYGAEIVVNVPGEQLMATEKTEDLTKSVDFVVKKMIRQIKRYKSKFQV